MSFIPPPLTRDRLAIIIRALQRRGGEMKRRDLNRFNAIEWWEIDQAEEQGFIITEKRKPRTGRPSEWAVLNGKPLPTHPFWERKDGSDRDNVSKTYQSKLPPARNNSDRKINRREWKFAFWYVCGEFGVAAGPFGFKRRAWFAYMKAYPKCQSQAGARASASRLMRRSTTKAAIAWEFAKFDGCRAINRFFPETALDIWDLLHRFGSERAAWAPPTVRARWILTNHAARQTPPIFQSQS